MLHLLITSALILQTTIPEPSGNVFKDYGIIGLLILLMLGMFKYFINDADKKSEAREKNIMLINDVREKAYTDLATTLKELVKRMGEDWRDTSNKIDRNYQDAINKFVQVIKEQGEQNNYAVQVLTELKERILEHTKSHTTSKDELEKIKTDINNALSKMVLEYNLTAKKRD